MPRLNDDTLDRLKVAGFKPDPVWARLNHDNNPVWAYHNTQGEEGGITILVGCEWCPFNGPLCTCQGNINFTAYLTKEYDYIAEGVVAGTHDFGMLPKELFCGTFSLEHLEV